MYVVIFRQKCAYLVIFAVLKWIIIILETGRPVVFSKPCSRRISEIEMVAFSDYRLVGTFVDACADDVSALSCGRVELLGNRPSYLSQGKVTTASLIFH